MKVIDKQLLFISSEERDSGEASDFTLSMPSHLLACQPHQKMRMVLNDVVMPYTWYNIQETNRHFEVVENGVATKVSLDLGSYHAIQLRDHLRDALNAATTAHYTYSVSFHEVNSRFTKLRSARSYAAALHWSVRSRSHRLYCVGHCRFMH